MNAVNYVLPYPKSMENGSDWAPYGIYLGLITLIPIFVAIILSLCIGSFFCFRHHGKCGGNRVMRGGYRKKQRRPIQIIIIAIFIIACIWSFICIIPNVLFFVFARNTYTTTWNLYDRSKSTLSSIQETISLINDSAASSVDHLNDYTSIYSQLYIETESIDQSAERMEMNLNNIQSYIRERSVLLSRSQEYNKNLIAKENEGKLSQVPESNRYSIDSSYSLDSANQTLNSIQEFTNLIMEYEITVQQYNMSTESKIENLELTLADDVYQSTQNALNAFSYVQQKIVDQKGDLIEATDIAYPAIEITRLIFISVSLIIFAIIFILGCVFAKKENITATKWMGKISCCGLFFWMICSCIAVLFTIGSSDLCDQDESVLSSILGSQFSAESLIQCQDGTTFLNVIGINSTFNIPEIMNEQLEMIKNERNEFSEDLSIISTANIIMENITQENDPELLRNQSLSVQSLQTTVSSLETQLNDLSNFGFDVVRYDTAIQAVNNFTQPEFGLVYNRTNIISLNYTISPYNGTLTNEEEQDVEQAQDMYNDYISVLEEISSVRHDIETIEILLFSVVNLTQSIQDSILDTHQEATTIRGTLNSIIQFPQQIDSQLNNLEEDFDSIINSPNILLQTADCSRTGELYREVHDAYCTQMIPFSAAGAFGFFILGVLCAILCAIAPVAAKRFHSYRPDIRSTHKAMSKAHHVRRDTYTMDEELSVISFQSPTVSPRDVRSSSSINENGDPQYHESDNMKNNNNKRNNTLSDTNTSMTTGNISPLASPSRSSIVSGRHSVVSSRGFGVDPSLIGAYTSPQNSPSLRRTKYSNSTITPRNNSNNNNNDNDNDNENKNNENNEKNTSNIDKDVQDNDNNIEKTKSNNNTHSDNEGSSETS